VPLGDIGQLDSVQKRTVDVVEGLDHELVELEGVLHGVVFAE
jgi:hypothetical protein